MINVYVDGSFNKKCGLSGWAFIILKNNDDPIIKNGNIQDDFKAKAITGEYQAVIESLYFLIKHKNILADEVVINFYHDYTALKYWINNNWKSNKLITLNYKYHIEDCLKELNNIDLNFIKVKSHSDDYWNDQVDLLAKKGCHLVK